MLLGGKIKNGQPEERQVQGKGSDAGRSDDDNNDDDDDESARARERERESARWAIKLRKEEEMRSYGFSQLCGGGIEKRMIDGDEQGCDGASAGWWK